MRRVAGPPGVSFAFIQQFLEDHQHIYGFEYALTTAEVVDKIIKPETSHHTCAYVDLYSKRRDRSGQPFVGAATIFLSHTWLYKFNEAVDVMEQCNSEQPGCYFWFDVFVLSQHTSLVSQSFVNSTVRDTIKQIGQVVVVMSPWQAPVPITRAWCLWELACALSNDVPVVMRLPTDQRHTLKDALSTDQARLIQAMSSVDAESAECTVPAEKQWIFTAIANSSGFHNLNNRVRRQLREFYVQALKDMSAATLARGTSQYDATLLMHVGSLFQELDMPQDALQCFQKSAAVCVEAMGAKHELTAISYERIGDLHMTMGEFGRAIEYHEMALEIIITTCGASHFSTAQSFNNLANVYLNKGLM